MVYGMQFGWGVKNQGIIGSGGLIVSSGNELEKQEFSWSGMLEMKTLLTIH